MSTRARFALAVLAGVLRFLAVPGFDQWYCAFLYLVPLLFAIEGVPVRRALELGLAFGLTGNVCGYFWLVGTLRNFSGFPLPLGIAIYLVLCLYQAGEYVLSTFLVHRALGRGFPHLLAVPAAVVATELIYPLLFPNYVGNALHRVPLLIQVADLGGALLVSVLAATVNVGIHAAIRALLRRERLPRRDLAVAGGALAATLLYGAWRIPRVEAAMAASPRLVVGLVQVNMGMFEKGREPAEGHSRHLEQSRELLAREPEIGLMVWPESAFNFTVPEVPNLAPFVTRGDVPVPLLFGGVRIERDAADRTRIFNAAFLIDARGNVTGTYDKTYLLLFGEYLPFGETFPALYELSPATGRFTAGSRLDPLPLGPFRISALVCYEDILPRFVNHAVAHARPHLLVNLTNDAWFGKTVEPEIHLGLAKLRAVEHRRFLVRSTNTGVSAIVDPIGRVTVRGGVFTRESLHGEVRLMDGATVYETAGDAVGFAAILGVLAMTLVGGRKRGGAK
jgi:apolipoprotein N-acyltransferase